MTELFRYIEHAFPQLPKDDTFIDVSTNSDFQNTLKDIRPSTDAATRMKQAAAGYLNAHFPVSQPPVTFSGQYRKLYPQLRAATTLNVEKARKTIEQSFDNSLKKIIQSDAWPVDKKLLNDAIVAFKLYPEFDKAEAADLVHMRQVMAFIESLQKMDDNDKTELQLLLVRPILVPASLLPPKKTNDPVTPTPDDDNQEQVTAIRKEMDELDKARKALLTLQPGDLAFEASTPIPKTAAPQNGSDPVHVQRVAFDTANEVLLSRINISNVALQQLAPEVQTTLNKFKIQDTKADLPFVVSRIEQKMALLSEQIQPYLMPQPARLFRVGVHVFAAKPNTAFKITTPQPAPDFSAAITKPLGIGNLQIVKQELLSYEAGEISHIENVLEGEKYSRSSKRSESFETTITQETETINSQERDLQSTERNEMVSESQKEVSKQAVSTKEQTTTTDYGKLVENNKASYARSITDRVVTSLTEKVTEKRVQKEHRSFTEKTTHEFDNSAGKRKVRGIYQWVNKRYRNRILNYGKRLLYDVTIPQPAAFLVDALKKAEQPEGLNFYKPEKPSILAKPPIGSIGFLAGGYYYKPLEPQDLNATNYMSLAARYGVAGAVEPPPTNYVNTLTWLSSGPGDVVYKADKITIRDGYKAISGYYQSTNWLDNVGNPAQNLDGAELHIGQSYFFKLTALNQGFKMNNETGELPITFCAGGMKGHNIAVGITCQDDTATPKWQLKTFAAIMEGYRKQQAEYEEKLRQLQTMIKAQVMAAQNYAHNPTIERDELKKAFINLIISEHFKTAYLPSPDPLQFPPDPVYTGKWGALVSFFERAFEWENMMYVYYPYFWAQQARWGELILIQDINPQFEEFLKAGAARVVVPVRPGFEAPIAHFHETGEVWMGKEMPDMFSEQYISIINEINERNFAPGKEQCVAEWDVVLPTALVMLKADEVLPEWKPSVQCNPNA